jgi:predicted ATPase
MCNGSALDREGLPGVCGAADTADHAGGVTTKLIELRATTSLARLLAGHGRRDDARARLAPLYAWFTEGFDAPDLVDAKALLEQLG